MKDAVSDERKLDALPYIEDLVFVRHHAKELRQMLGDLGLHHSADKLTEIIATLTDKLEEATSCQP